MDVKDLFLSEEEIQDSWDLTHERHNMDVGDPIDVFPEMVDATNALCTEQVLKFMAWLESQLTHDAVNLYVLWREARMELTARLPKVKTCEHDWMDARNHIVATGEVCGKCYAYKP